MKVQYVAYDGKIFDNRDECRAYEGKDILMGNLLGNRTFGFETNANFVCIPDAKTLKLFQEIYGESSDAKNITDVGFYIWDFDEFEYMRINLETFEGLKNFLREYCN